MLPWAFCPAGSQPPNRRAQDTPMPDEITQKMESSVFFGSRRAKFWFSSAPAFSSRR
jgi:hypothetical protein